METINNKSSIKDFEIKINNKDYILNLGIKSEENKIFIILKSKDIFNLNFYQFESTYENLIKLNKYFNGFESLEEIEEEILNIIADKKYSVENDNKNIKIILDLNFGKKTRKIEIILEKTEISVNTILKQNEKIKEQELRIKELEKEISEYKENNNLLKKILSEVSDMKNTINFFYGNVIDSKIIKSQKELDLIKNALKTIYNKDTNFKLLFRASKDGETVSSFHQHCDGIPNTLSIMQGVKG